MRYSLAVVPKRARAAVHDPRLTQAPARYGKAACIAVRGRVSEVSRCHTATILRATLGVRGVPRACRRYARGVGYRQL